MCRLSTYPVRTTHCTVHDQLCRHLLDRRSMWLIRTSTDADERRPFRISMTSRVATAKTRRRRRRASRSLRWEDLEFRFPLTLVTLLVQWTFSCTRSANQRLYSGCEHAGIRVVKRMESINYSIMLWLISYKWAVGNTEPPSKIADHFWGPGERIQNDGLSRENAISL